MFGRENITVEILSTHAGTPDKKQNQSKPAQKSFRSRHQCAQARAGTSRALACEVLWSDKLNATSRHAAAACARWTWARRQI